MKLTDIFLDDSGKLSSSRILSYIICLAYLVFVGFLTYKTASLIDIPVGAAGLIAALYGLNKFSPTIPFNGGKD